MLLLPEVVDDYVGADNPVRFIDAFVDGLDLATASFSGHRGGSGVGLRRNPRKTPAIYWEG